MVLAIVLGALSGALGVLPLFLGLRMTRRVTDTSNLGHAGALMLRHPFPRSHRLRRPRARHSGALRLGGSGGARCLRNRLRRIYICTEVGWEGKTREST